MWIKAGKAADKTGGNWIKAGKVREETLMKDGAEETRKRIGQFQNKTVDYVNTMVIPPDWRTNPKGALEYIKKNSAGSTLNKLERGEYVSPESIDSLISYAEENNGWAAKKNPSVLETGLAGLNKDALDGVKEYYGLFEDEEDYRDRKETVDLQLQYGNYSYSQLEDEINRLKAESKSSGDKEKLNKKIDWLENYSVSKTYGSEKDYKDAAAALQKNINELKAAKKDARSPGETEMYNRKIKEKQDRLDALNSANRYVKYNELIDNDDFKDTVADAGLGFSYGLKIENGKLVYDKGFKSLDDIHEESLRFAQRRKTMPKKGPSINALPDEKPDYESVRKHLGSWKTNVSEFYRLTGHTYSDYENGEKEVATTPYTDSYKYTTHDEDAILVYLRETKGQDVAWEYLQDLKPLLGERMRQSELSDWERDYDNSGVLGKAGYQILSSLYNVYGGIAAAAEDIAAVVTGEEINPYSGAHYAQQVGQYIREITSEDISAGIDNEFLSKLASTTYQGIMSGADMLVGGGTLGKWGYVSAMAAGAFSSKARELYQRGATRDQIAAGAALASATEFLTETIGADRFFKTWNSAALKDFFKNLGVQMTAESLEEIASDIGDLANEAIVMGGNSNYQTAVREYINSGMTEEQAKKKAAAENIAQMVWDAYAAAVSVGLSGGGKGAGLSLLKANDAYIQSKADRSAGEAIIKKWNTDLLIDYALSESPGSKTYKIAETLKENKSRSEAKQVGRLYNALITHINNQIAQKTKTSVIKQLEAFVENPSETAAVIVDMAQMKTVDEKEKEAVLNNPKTRSVYEALTAESEHPQWISELTEKISGLRGKRNLIALAPLLDSEDFKEVYNLVKGSDREAAGQAAGGESLSTGGEINEGADISAPFADVRPEVITLKSDNKIRRHLNKAEQDYVKRIAGAFDVNVIFENVKEVTGISGDSYYDSSGSIHMDYSVTNPLNILIKHELTHFGEESREYNDFVSLVKDSKVFKDWINSKISGEKSTSAKSAQYRKEIMQRYENAGKALTVAEADAEMIANFVADSLFTEDGAGLDALIKQADAKDRPVIIQWIIDFINSIKSLFKGNYTPPEISGLERKYTEMLKSAEKTRKEESKKNTAEGGKKFNISDKTIKVNMPDSERAEILKNSEIKLAEYDGRNEDLNVKNVLLLKSSYNSQAGKILKSLGEKFGVFKTYNNKNISLDFDYSRGSLNESVHKQGDISTDFYDFAKMLYVFDEVVENAVPIEVHTDKYVGTARENVNLKYDYVLLSAFRDESYIIPVEMHIKEFKEDVKDLNKLYVSITLGKIKIEDEVKVHLPDLSKDNQTNNTRSSSTISIPYLISKINPEYGNFYKYLPASMLTEEQNRSKKTAVDDENYRLKVMRGEDVTDILEGKAKEKGYVRDDGGTTELRAPNSQNVKILDVTYDDNGNLIPLSKRFDKDNPDIRYFIDIMSEKSGKAASDNRSRRLNKAEQEYVKKVAGAFGVNVIFENVEGVTGIPGDSYYDSSGSIHMDYSVTNPLNILIKHELTHFGEESREYNDFVSLVKDSKVFKDWINSKISGEKSTSAKSAQYRKEIMQRYENAGKALTVAEADAEMIANFVADSLFTEDGAGLDALIKQADAKDRPVIIQWIIDFINSIKSLFKGNYIPPEISRLERKYTAMLKAAEKTLDDTSKKNTAGDGRKFSIAFENAKGDLELLKEVENVERGEFEPKKKTPVGNINQSQATLIKKITGIDVTGYRVFIENRQIAHIIKEHGKNGRSDHSLADNNDISKIPFIIENNNNIVAAGTTQSYVSNIEGNNKPAKTVLYEKPIGEKSYYVVEAVPETSKKALYVVSAFIGKSGYKKETLQSTDAKSPGVTPNSEAVNVSVNNIPYSSEYVKKNTTDDGRKLSISGKYDYSKSFAEQIDDWEKGLIPLYDSLIVSGTPELYRNIGFTALPMTINQTHVDYALNGTKDTDHKLGETLLKQLPDRLKNPIAVFKSETKPGRVVALLDFTHNGKQIITPVEIDGYGRQNDIIIDSNAIASVFGKSNAVTKLLYNAVLEEKNGKTTLFYWNKKVAVSLLQRAGLQLPGGLPQDGYIHSITDSGSNVNKKFSGQTDTQQFKRWFGKSRVVDKNGEPLIVYRNKKAAVSLLQKAGLQLPGVLPQDGYIHSITDSGSNVNKKFSGQTDTRQFKHWFGEWDYFTTERPDGTENNGSNAEQVYLKIEKPFVFDGGTGKSIFGQFEEKHGISAESYDELQELMQENGYDGVIQYTDSSGGMTAVVFDSTQIKSATDNIGTFDSDNPDIRYSIGRMSEKSGKAAADNRSRRQLSSAEQDYVKRIAGAFGVNVIFEDVESVAGTAAESYYDFWGNIHMDYAVTDPVNILIKHELTHFGETDSEVYADFVRAVKDSEAYRRWLDSKISGNMPADVKAGEYRDIIRSRYEAAGVMLSPEETDAELIANFVADSLFTEDGAGLDALIKQADAKDRPVIIQWIIDFINSIKSLFKGNYIPPEISRLERKYTAMLKAAEKTLDDTGQKNTAENDGVKFMARDSGDNSIKEQIKENSDLLNSMEAVADLKEFKIFENKPKAKEWVLKRFENIDYKVHRNGFGEIILDEKRIKRGLSYLKTNEEILAFAAVPQVLKFGEEIAGHDKHKGRAYDTVTFAAPIVLNGQRGNLAVVVRQEGKNYYKVHRLLMPDGSQFIFNTKRDIAETAGGVNNNSGLSPTDNVSDNSIPDSSENVNIKNTAGKDMAGDTPVNNGASEKAENSAGEFSVVSSNGSPEVRNYETGAAAGLTVDSASGAQYNENANGSQSGIDAADGAYNIGSSGWLGNGGRRPSGKAVERFDGEYFVRLSEKPVSGMDTAGRRLSLELQRRLNNTALKNSDGSVLSLYHWTSHKFKVFAKGELGFHFGTFKAAQKRKSDLSEGTDGYYKEVYLNIKNPIYFKEDFREWIVQYLARRLYKMHIINGLEHERTRECKGFYSTDYGSEAAVELRAILKNKGYDGIVYYNQYEGDFSVIAFDPEQVITVAENGITAEEAGVTWPEENYKGDNYGNQDTGVLAGRGVSAFGGDRDGIRQQGENSQILYEFLAGDNGVRQRSRDTAPVKPNELYRLHKNTYELSDTAERENTFRLRESDAGDIRERRVNEDGEGERSHGNQDTGVLAGRGVSAFGGDRDGIRQQGENSAALYGFMEGNERGRQGSRDFAFGEQNGLYGKRNKRFGLSDTAERENTFRLRESDAGDIRERRVNEDAYGGGEKSAVPEQRGYSEDNGQRGETKGYRNAGAYKENERAWRESEEAFTGRTVGNQEKAGRGRRILLRHNNSLLAYYEKQPDNTPAGRAVSRLRSYGVEAVYCDGALESNQSGITKRHTGALTAPDGTVFVSSLATLSEIEIASHETLHSSEQFNRDIGADFTKSAFSLPESENADAYSYETLISKPDMKVTVLDKDIPDSRAAVVAAAKRNAAAVGRQNTDGSVSVYVKDIKTDVAVTKKSLVHGLDRRLSVQAPVLAKIGNILENAIKINELSPRADNVKKTYLLIGSSYSHNGDFYVTSFLVNKYSNEINEIDVLYAANAKMEPAALLPKFTDKAATPTDSTISIAELLEYVNRYFPDILPEDVLRHFGHSERPAGKLGGSALYSLDYGRAPVQSRPADGADFTKSAFSLPESGNEYAYYDAAPDYEGESGGLSGAYSYEALTAKPDMKIITVNDSVEYSPTANVRKNIVDTAVKNAAEIGYTNDNGNAVVYVKDIGAEIVISKNGLRHGLDRRFKVLAPITLKAGEILENSIKINELLPQNDKISNSYSLVGIAKNQSNEPYIISFVVNRVTNEVTSIDVLYAVNAKTESAGSLSPGVPAETDYLTDSTISIAELLEYVNRYFPDILPEDVLRHFEHSEGPAGKLGGSALYSLDYGFAPRESMLREPSDEDLRNNISIEDEIEAGVRNEEPVPPERRLVEHLAGIFGLNVEWSDNPNIRGKYLAESRTVVLNSGMSAAGQTAEIFGHELTHDLERRRLYKGFARYLAEESPAFAEYVKQRLSELGIYADGLDSGLDLLLDRIAETYKSSEVLSESEAADFGRESALKELIADFVGEKIFGDGDIDTLREIAGHRPTVFERIINWIKDLISRITGSARFRTLEEDLKYIRDYLSRVYHSRGTHSDTATEYALPIRPGRNIFSEYRRGEINRAEAENELIEFAEDVKLYYEDPELYRAGLSNRKFDWVNFGLGLLQWRLSQNHSQNYVADALGIEVDYLSRIENGLKSIGPKLMAKIETLTGYTSEQLSDPNFDIGIPGIKDTAIAYLKREITQDQLSKRKKELLGLKYERRRSEKEVAEEVPDMYESDISKSNVYAGRRQYGMTMEEFANEIGVDAKTISNIEKNKHQPANKSIMGAANFLKVPLSDFTGLEIDATEKELEVINLLAKQFKKGKINFEELKLGLVRQLEIINAEKYDISGNESLEDYRDNYDMRINTKNGLQVELWGSHYIDRSDLRNVSLVGIIDALENPLYIGSVKTDKNGKDSIRFIGYSTTVNINPSTGHIITVWQTSKKLRKKYQR